jgi:hypothetical protein
MSCRTGLVPSSVSTSSTSQFLGAHLTETPYRVKEKLQSGEMHVRGDQWPLFLYADLAYDPEDPWNGLLRSQLLVAVRAIFSLIAGANFLKTGIQARLHLPELRR